MSQYKIRTQRRKKNYAPYQTKKEQGIVSRVWEWLTPSSWWSGTATDPSPPPSPPPGPSHDQSHDQPPLSCDHSSSVTADAEVATTSSAKPSLMVTEPYVPMEPSVEQRHVMNGMEPDDDSRVAEDGDTWGVSGWTGQETGLSGDKTGQTGLPGDKTGQTGLPGDKAGQTGLPGDKTGQTGLPAPTAHCVEKIQNPSFGTVPNHALSPSLFRSGLRHGTGFASRVLRTRPLSTSTPQLSPVNESDEQGQSRRREEESVSQHHNNRDSHHGNRLGSKLPSIPEKSPCHTVKSVFHATPSTSTVTAMTTRAQHYTDLSLSRSPFQSPFYSGRTSYGGAASGQRLRTVKRPRTESSSPMMATVQLTVTAKPHPLAPPTSLPLSSSTARKILHTLDSLSSPLADARKLPLRGTVDSDRQPARKRHKSAHAALSPPPIASLSTPTLNSLPVPTPRPPPRGPVIVPNEKSLRRKQPSEQSSLVGVTLRPERQTTRSIHTTPPPANSSIGSKGQSSPQTSTQSPSWLSTAPLPPSTSFSPVLPPSATTKLSSITFTAPPFPSQPVSPDHTKQTSTSPAGMASRPVPNFTPTFHASSSSPLATSGGKMRLPRSSRTHHSHHHDNPDEGEVPVSMVPQVGLKLSGNTSSFNFTRTIPPLKPASTKITQATKTPPNYSFSTPKQVTSESSVQDPTKQLSSSFQFSVPKPCTPSKSQPQATPPHPPALTTRRQATPTKQEAPPPLKSISVVDILKQPAYQSLTAGKVASTATHLPDNKAVVDLTEDSEKTAVTRNEGEEVTAKAPPSLLSSGFKHVPISSLPSSSSLLQSTPTPSVSLLPPSTVTMSGLPSLVKPSTSIAQSSFKPLTGFSVPAGSWECGTCLVQNRSSHEKCVACATTRPAANQSTKLTTPPPPPSSGAVSRLTPLPQFSAPTGSWECATCMVPNAATQSKCVACATPKPGGVASGNLVTEETAVQPPMIKLGAQGGLQLGSGGLQFGKPSPVLSGGISSRGSSSLTPLTAGSDTTKTPPTTTPLQPLAQFAPPEGSWSCDTCMVSNKKVDSKCVACGTSKTGNKTGNTADISGEKSANIAPMVFGTGGGLKLGAVGQGGDGVKISVGAQGGGGGLKVGNGGLKFGDGGLKLGDGGLKLGDGGLKLGDGGLKLGDGGPQFGSKGLTEGSSLHISGGAPQANPLPTGFQGIAGTGMPPCGSGSRSELGPKLTAGPQVSLGFTSQEQSSANPLCTPVSTSLPPSTALPAAGPSLTFSATSSAPTIGQSPLLPALTQPPLGASLSLSDPHSTTPAIFPTGGLSSTAATNTLSSMTAPAPSLPFGPGSLTSFPFQPASSQSATTTSPSLQPPPFQFGQSRQTTSAGFTFGATTTTSGLTFGPTTTTSGFTFGPTTTTSGLTFGPTTTTSGFTFGPTTTTSGLTFGPTTTTSGLTFGATTSTSGLTFGPTTTSSAGFTFSGANPSTGQTSSVGLEPSRQSSLTGFNFSGANSSMTETSQVGFNFGAAATPSFSFGASPSTSTGLSFSGVPSSSAAPMFQLPHGQTGMFTGGVAPPTTTGRVIRRARRRKN